MRTGFGYDVHRLVAGRRLLIGGVEIPFPLGLHGHSDADVLLHAVVDAILGAASLGDIGRHFPPDDLAYKDISSLTLLSRTGKLLDEKGFYVVNIDSTVVCEAPKLSPYIAEMAANIEEALRLAPGSVNIKAKTEEGLGFTGKGEGISAYAITLIEEKSR